MQLLGAATLVLIILGLYWFVRHIRIRGSILRDNRHTGLEPGEVYELLDVVPCNGEYLVSLRNKHGVTAIFFFKEVPPPRFRVSEGPVRYQAVGASED